MVATASRVAEVVMAVLGIEASCERQRMTARTAADRVQAKARGVKFGRRAALTAHQQTEALQRLAKGDTQRTVAALLGVDQATISRLSRKQGRSEERRVGKECVSTCRSRWSPYH